MFGGYEGWEVQVDIKCRRLTQGLIYQLRNKDGTKSKQKTIDPKTGVKYERYEHLSDCLDYLLCYYLHDSWYKPKSGGDRNGYMVSALVTQEGPPYQQRSKDMYKRFLNSDDYLGVITPEALAQLTRGNNIRFAQAEGSTGTSIVEHLSKNYKIEKEFAKGKYIVGYDRRVTYPVGVHAYFEGQIREVIRSVSGYRKPAMVVYQEESSDVHIDTRQVVNYSQSNTYYPGDKVNYNGIVYTYLSESGYRLGDICIPLVGGWIEVGASLWQPVEYPLWIVTEYEGASYTLMTFGDFDYSLDPIVSDRWGTIADYDSSYNTYESSGHKYIVYDGRVFYPETDANADTPQAGQSLSLRGPCSYNLKKHMTQLAIYELTKLIAPNNASVARMHDYEDSMKWLNGAVKPRLNPQIPRKVDGSKKPVTDWQLATLQTDHDPCKNPWTA